jgi:hypothetical protein
LAGAGLELPAVVFALDLIAIEPAGGKGDAAVRAEVAHGEEGAVALAAEEQGDAEEEGGAGFAGGQGGGAGGGVPVAEDEFGGWAGLVCAGLRVGICLHSLNLKLFGWEGWELLAKRRSFDSAQDDKFCDGGEECALRRRTRRSG